MTFLDDLNRLADPLPVVKPVTVNGTHSLEAPVDPQAIRGARQKPRAKLAQVTGENFSPVSTSPLPLRELLLGWFAETHLPTLGAWAFVTYAIMLKHSRARFTAVTIGINQLARETGLKERWVRKQLEVLVDARCIVVETRGRRGFGTTNYRIIHPAPECRISHSITGTPVPVDDAENNRYPSAAYFLSTGTPVPVSTGTPVPPLSPLKGDTATDPLRAGGCDAGIHQQPGSIRRPEVNDGAETIRHPSAACDGPDGEPRTVESECGSGVAGGGEMVSAHVAGHEAEKPAGGDS